MSLAASFATLRAAAERVVDERAADGSGAQAQGWHAILDLKARNRELYMSLEARRVQTAEAKAALEKTHLQLQNLLYEKAHYAKEIKNCREFKSAFRDDEVALASEAEFLRTAPAVDAASPHARMLSRLAFELAERKRLAEDLLALKGRRTALQEAITGHRKLVLAMSSELSAVKKATATLACMVGSPDSVLLSSRAALLPPPLLNLYKSFEGSGWGSPSLRFQLAVLGRADSAPEELAGAGDGEADEGERAARQNEDRGEGLAVTLDLFSSADSSASLLGIRFELAAGGGARVVVERGDPAVLHLGLDGAMEEGQAEASPRWLQQLSETVDCAAANAVIAALFAAAAAAAHNTQV